MRVVGTTNSGLVRENNEDNHRISRENGLLMVADGMGGHAAGEVASKIAVETVGQFLAGMQAPGQEELRQAITAANSTITKKAQTDPLLAGMGTTFTMAAISPGILLTGHIGDSMAFLIDAKAILPLTSDHSVSGQLLAAGKITEAEAACHPQRHVLTRALGADPCPEIEARCYPWQPGQYLLLCTDGLTKVVATGEIWEVVAGNGNLRTKINRLLSLVFERGAPDNVTIILARL